MVINLMLFLLFLSIFACLLRKNSDFASNIYLIERDSTDSLKGFSIVIIVFSHIMQNAPELRDIVFGGRITYKIVVSWGAVGVALFFLLSGYGCFLSISKSTNDLRWLIRHWVKCIIYFAIVYVVVFFVNRSIFKEVFSTKEYIRSIFTLRMPGTSTWYLKIQLLFYVFLVLSHKLKKYQLPGIYFCIVAYSIIAFVTGLSDFWWKTSLCFAVGCTIANYNETIMKYKYKMMSKVIVLVTGLCAYLFVLADSKYIFGLQLLAYAFIAVCITYYWNILFKRNIFYIHVGKTSFALYLFHTGVITKIYQLSYNVSIKTYIFLITIIIGTVICYFLVEKTNNRIMKWL